MAKLLGGTTVYGLLSATSDIVTSGDIVFDGGAFITASGSAAGSINTSGEPNIAFGGYGGNIYTYGTYGQTGGSIDTHGDQTGSGGNIKTYSAGGNIDTTFLGGSINTSNNGGAINTSNNGGSIDTTGQGYIALGNIPTRTTLQGTAANTGAALQRIINLPNADGTLALQSYADNKFLPLSGGSITGNISMSGDIMPYVSGRGTHLVISSDPINLLTTVGTVSSIYQCPNGFRFLPEEISYTYSTITFTGTPTNITITNPIVRVYSSSSSTTNTDMGPQLTFPFNSGSTQLINRWFRSSNTATTTIGRPMLIGGSSGNDTAYLRVDTAYSTTDASNKYTDVKIKVIMTGYLIKN
jgi:hypothetical protein